MQIHTQIKKYRTDMKLSQEALAEKLYVTRQTISNWENAKTYPDIHSLLLLSSLFGVSIDQLIKGDVEIMKEEINKDEIKKLDRYSGIYTVLLLATVISVIPLIKWMSFYAFFPWGILAVITLYVAVKIEKMKKEHNIFTYKEIVAFTEGKKLDEISRQREIGKRPYQQFLLVLASGTITIIILVVLGWLLS